MPYKWIAGRLGLVLTLLLLPAVMGPSFLRIAPAGTLPEMQGIVTGLEGDLLYVSGYALTDDALDDIIVHMAHAEVYDMLTGFPVEYPAIVEGMNVRVAYYDSPEEWQEAAAVWINIGEEGAAAFKTVVSGNIQYGENSCTFMTNDGRYRITLTEETFITDAYDGYIEPADIMPGDEVFIWADIMTASSPAQIYPDMAVLIYR